MESMAPAPVARISAMATLALSPHCSVGILTPNSHGTFWPIQQGVTYFVAKAYDVLLHLFGDLRQFAFRRSLGRDLYLTVQSLLWSGLPIL